jgi:hypothetical protein
LKLTLNTASVGMHQIFVHSSAEGVEDFKISISVAPTPTPSQPYMTATLTANDLQVGNDTSSATVKLEAHNFTLASPTVDVGGSALSAS